MKHNLFIKNVSIITLTGLSLLMPPNTLNAQITQVNISPNSENILFERDDSITVNFAKSVFNIERFNFDYPQEKVYVHFDNTGYYLGETIWFKAYTVLTSKHIPTTLSKVLYVELLDSYGDIIDKKKLKLENGTAHGEFDLKDGMRSGFYEVRAYTRVMLNWGDEAVFSRVFPVFNRNKLSGDYTNQTISPLPKTQSKPNSRIKSPKNENLNVVFFPEGGNLIEGINSVIAFKVTNKNGESLNAKCELLNAENEIISEFSTLHKGMGKFNFFAINEEYKVNVITDSGKEIFKLPKAMSTGYTLNVINTMRNSMIIQANRNEQTKGEVLGLSLMCGGKVYMFQEIDLRSESSKALRVNYADLPSGVIQITLFNQGGKPYSERLAFNNNHDYINVSIIDSNLKNIKPHQELNIKIKAIDKEKMPVKTNLSVSVKDLSSVNETAYSDNILSNLLLTSEIKGYIEDIDYYFESDDVTHKTNLDLLMLTQGWRRYNWEAMASYHDTFDINYPAEKGIVIDGRVVSSLKKRDLKRIDVGMSLYSEDGFKQNGTCKTDDNGNFNFMLSDFPGKADLLLKTTDDDKAKSSTIMINRLFSPAPRALTFHDKIWKKNSSSDSTDFTTIEFNTDDMQESYQRDSLDNLSKILPEISITTRKKTKLSNEGLDVSAIIYNTEEEIDRLIDSGVGDTESVAEFLNTLNPYFSYYPDTLGRSICRYKGKKILFLYDNMTFDACNKDLDEILVSELNTIAISETPGLARVYFNDFNPEADITDILTKQDLDRTVVIFMYSNRKGANKSKKGMRNTTIYGYSKVKEFYVPSYREAALPEDILYRRTLYWNPNIMTNEYGEAEIKFFNNSTCKRTEIDVQGIHLNGDIIIKE